MKRKATIILIAIAVYEALLLIVWLIFHGKPWLLSPRFAIAELRIGDARWDIGPLVTAISSIWHVVASRILWIRRTGAAVVVGVETIFAVPTIYTLSLVGKALVTGDSHFLTLAELASLLAIFAFTNLLPLFFAFRIQREEKS